MSGKIALPLATALLLTGSAWAQMENRTAGAGDGAAEAEGVVEQAAVDPATAPAEVPEDAALPSTNPDGQFITRPTPEQMRAVEIIGKEVVNSAGDEIGSVSDILLDKDGKITGIVIKSGGVFGIGGKQVAVSASDLPDMTGAKVLLAGFTEQELHRAPEFEAVDKDRPEILGGKDGQGPD